jgi:hypothetical protein
MRVLLVQMPFFTVDSPSIGLSMVSGALADAGHECDIEYFNLELGARLGTDLYTWIARDSPTHLRLGDLIFAPLIRDSDLSLERWRSLISPSGRLGVLSVPEEIIQAFPKLVAASRRFLEDMLQETRWSDYDLVGMSTMFTIAPALALARRIKSLRNAPPVILGGSYCKGEVGERLVRNFRFIDFVCCGEGERLIVQLMAHLSGGGVRCEDIRGLAWRDCYGNVRKAPAARNPETPTQPAFGHQARN